MDRPCPDDSKKVWKLYGGGGGLSKNLVRPNHWTFTYFYQNSLSLLFLKTIFLLNIHKLRFTWEANLTWTMWILKMKTFLYYLPIFPRLSVMTSFDSVSSPSSSLLVTMSPLIVLFRLIEEISLSWNPLNFLNTIVTHNEIKDNWHLCQWTAELFQYANLCSTLVLEVVGHDLLTW